MATREEMMEAYGKWYAQMGKSKEILAETALTLSSIMNEVCAISGSTATGRAATQAMLQDIRTTVNLLEQMQRYLSNLAKLLEKSPEVRNASPQEIKGMQQLSDGMRNEISVLKDTCTRMLNCYHATRDAIMPKHRDQMDELEMMLWSASGSSGLPMETLIKNMEYLSDFFGATAEKSRIVANYLPHITD